MQATSSSESPVFATWLFDVFGAPSGDLTLYQGRTGFFWNWKDKPAHLVDLVGVGSHNRDLKWTWFFPDVTAAVQHILMNSGEAFHGKCAMLKSRTPA